MIDSTGKGNSIVGGACNLMNGLNKNYSTISGGYRNRIIGNSNFIGSGCNNQILFSNNSSILSGNFNEVGDVSNIAYTGDSNTIGSGIQNTRLKLCLLLLVLL